MVIDSIAALFRSEYGVQQVVQRAQVLQACGSRLQHLSETYGVAVVCVNQVYISEQWCQDRCRESIIIYMDIVSVLTMSHKSLIRV